MVQAIFRALNVEIVLTSSSAIPATPPGSLKRNREASGIDHHDVENFGLPLPTPNKKKNRAGLDESTPSMKHALFNFDLVMTKPLPRAIQPLRRSTQIGVTHKLKTPVNVKPLASSRNVNSAPPAAGRSSKDKAKGLLKTHRTPTTSYTRVDPPSDYGFLPFSIDTAVTATAPLPSVDTSLSKEDSVVHCSTSQGSASKGCAFVIHEESELSQLETLMGTNYRYLDLSDDDERFDAMNDRGKENVPPADDPNATVNTNIPTSRRNLMTDEPRTPLGDLNVAEYYAEGLTSESQTIVPADDEVEEQIQDSKTNSKTNCGQSDANATSDVNHGWDDLLAQVEAATKAKSGALDSEFAPNEIHDKSDTSSVIEIWESGSASSENEAENEAAAHDVPASAVA